ncbi:MAG: DinB family protein [Bryobacteraceae bacterium]
MRQTALRREIVGLAGVIPEGKYEWRPNEGNHSVGQAYLHLASANSGIPVFLGIKPPAGLERDAETKIKSKKEILDLLTTSVENASNTALSMPDAVLDREVKFFGGKRATKRSVLCEHLGQSIAHARMNNVIPPWSTGKGE